MVVCPLHYLVPLALVLAVVEVDMVSLEVSALTKFLRYQPSQQSSLLLQDPQDLNITILF